MLAEELALTVAAVFTGRRSTFCPRRVEAGLLAGLHHGASLAIVGGLFGLIAYLSTPDWRWLLGAVVLLANGPTRSS
jgi:hypothetical protein